MSPGTSEMHTKIQIDEQVCQSVGMEWMSCRRDQPYLKMEVGWVQFLNTIFSYNLCENAHNKVF
jgi:hypothetical protein